MTFAIWRHNVELLIDTITLTLNNQVRIFASLLPDVAVRYPAAFAVTAPVTLFSGCPLVDRLAYSETARGVGVLGRLPKKQDGQRVLTGKSCRHRVPAESNRPPLSPLFEVQPLRVTVPW
jgi:hypothetical protein